MPQQIERKTVTRLCKKHTIVTINGQLPGPTIHVSDADTVIVKYYNKSQYNATLHWYVSTAIVKIIVNITPVVVIDRLMIL